MTPTPHTSYWPVAVVFFVGAAVSLWRRQFKVAGVLVLLGVSILAAN